MIHSVYRDFAPYTTKDGSTIRERMHPDIHDNRAPSLAEARIAPGGRARRHRHRETEEIYYFLCGRGHLDRNGDTIPVAAGITALIPPGSWYRLANAGTEDLVSLCCCSPAYAHADTERPTSDPGGAG